MLIFNEIVTFEQGSTDQKFNPRSLLLESTKNVLISRYGRCKKSRQKFQSYQAGSTLLKISPERRLGPTIITNCKSVFRDKVMILIISAALDTF